MKENLNLLIKDIESKLELLSETLIEVKGDEDLENATEVAIESYQYCLKQLKLILK
jgi:hypothetical protein